MLVVGGSQGAKRLNDTLAASHPDILAAGWQIVHLTGERREGVEADVAGYVTPRYEDRMDLAFALADLVVARAGSATVSEIEALGIPAVFVPYAVGNGEQERNARAAVEAGAAILVPDAAFTPERVRTEIVPLLQDEERRRRMRAAAAEVGTRTGTENVVALVDEALGR